MSSFASFSSDSCGSVLQPNTSLSNLPVMARADSTRSSRKRKRVSKSQREAMESSLPVVKHHHSVKKPQTPSVSRRNARERNRVKQVNNGFSTLRNHIPNLKNKTSKVDTLRAAVDYIKALRRLVGEDEEDNSENCGDFNQVFDLADFDSDEVRSASNLSNDELYANIMEFGNGSRSPSLSPIHNEDNGNNNNNVEDVHQGSVVALVIGDNVKENTWWINRDHHDLGDNKPPLT